MGIGADGDFTEWYAAEAPRAIAALTAGIGDAALRPGSWRHIGQSPAGAVRGGDASAIRVRSTRALPGGMEGVLSLRGSPDKDETAERSAGSGQPAREGLPGERMLGRMAAGRPGRVCL